MNEICCTNKPEGDDPGLCDEHSRGQFRSSFAHLQAGLNVIRKLARVVDARDAPSFNLFRLMNVEKNECKLHSPFLAELLNPHGTHGQGELFLKTFLTVMADKYPGDFPRLEESIDTSRWFVVQREKHIETGRLDIVVYSPSIGFLMVIENKPRSNEEPDQLKRYYDWMQRMSCFYEHRMLIFLTSNGRKSQTASGCKYYRMSYQKEVSRWLKEVINSIGASHVRETVNQYIDIILDSGKFSMA